MQITLANKQQKYVLDAHFNNSQRIQHMLKNK